MALVKEDMVDLYRRRAKHYNFTANLYYLLGFREWKYRKQAVKELNLKHGDTVVEIGCGTGLNCSLLQNEVGPEGKIIGVDVTDAMLDQALGRVSANDWLNVELVQSDAAKFRFPAKVDGIISTFAPTLVPEFDTVIRNGCMALSPGRRWVILDLKMPSNWLSYLTPLFIFLVKPFGVMPDLAARHPWESMERYLQSVTRTEIYMGFAYIVVGKRGKDGCQEIKTKEDDAP